MCCFAKPVCLTFIVGKFMGKKKVFFFRASPGFFLVGFAGSFSGGGSSQTREGGDIFCSQWLQQQPWPFPQPTLSQDSFQPVIQPPLQIFNRNIKHLIISQERDAAWWPWKANVQVRQGSLVPWMDGPRSRCFVLELGVKPRQGVHNAALSPWETAFWGEAENPELLCLLYGWGNLQEG